MVLLGEELPTLCVLGVRVLRPAFGFGSYSAVSDTPSAAPLVP